MLQHMFFAQSHMQHLGFYVHVSVLPNAGICPFLRCADIGTYSIHSIFACTGCLDCLLAESKVCIGG